MKHAQASTVWLSVVHEGGWLTVEIRDDGIGGASFDCEDATGLGGLGTVSRPSTARSRSTARRGGHDGWWPRSRSSPRDLDATATSQWWGRHRGMCRRRATGRRDRRGGRAARSRPRLWASRGWALAGRPARRERTRRVARVGVRKRRPPGREPIDFSRARVVGGCSAHNGCIAAVGCVRTTTAGRVDRGRRLGCRRDSPAHHTRTWPPPRAPLRGRRDRAVSSRVPQAAAALGYARLDDLDDLDGGVGFGTEPVNVEHGVRVNAAFAYLDPARGRPNLRRARRDAVRQSRATRAATRPSSSGCGRVARFASRRDTVVLAAGAYGSPAILLRSGVGDPVELGRLGIPVVSASPGVGRNLHDHPLVELEFTGSDGLREALRAASRRDSFRRSRHSASSGRAAHTARTTCTWSRGRP